MNIKNENEIKDYLDKIYKLNFTPGKSLVGLSTYEEIALWWFVNFDYWMFLRKSQNLANNIKKTQKKDFIHRFKKSILFNLLILGYLFGISQLCKINVKLYKSNSQGRGKKILITAQNIEWKRTWSESENLFKIADAFFHSTVSLLEKSNSNYEIVTTYPVGSPISGLKIIADKRRSQKNITHKPFDIYFSIDIWKKRKNATKYFIGLWDEIKKEKTFWDLFEFNGIKFSLIETKISNYFSIFIIFSRVLFNNKCYIIKILKSLKYCFVSF